MKHILLLMEAFDIFYYYFNIYIYNIYTSLHLKEAHLWGIFILMGIFLNISAWIVRCARVRASFTFIIF